MLCQKRPFDQIKNAAQLGVRVARDGLRPPLDKLPPDTPPAVVDMMVLCWDADRTKRQPAARFFETLANELGTVRCMHYHTTQYHCYTPSNAPSNSLPNPASNPPSSDLPPLIPPHLIPHLTPPPPPNPHPLSHPLLTDMLEELEERRGMGGFGQGGRNRMGQTMMVSVQQMLAELKQGQMDLKEGQQQIMHSIQDLNVQLTASLTGLGQSLSDLGAIAMTDPKAEQGIEMIAKALQAHRVYVSSAQLGGESSSSEAQAQAALLRAITEATAALQPGTAPSHHGHPPCEHAHSFFSTHPPLPPIPPAGRPTVRPGDATAAIHLRRHDHPPPPPPREHQQPPPPRPPSVRHSLPERQVGCVVGRGTGSAERAEGGPGPRTRTNGPAAGAVFIRLTHTYTPRHPPLTPSLTSHRCAFMLLACLLV